MQVKMAGERKVGKNSEMLTCSIFPSMHSTINPFYLSPFVFANSSVQKIILKPYVNITNIPEGLLQGCKGNKFEPVLQLHCKPLRAQDSTVARY